MLYWILYLDNALKFGSCLEIFLKNLKHKVALEVFWKLATCLQVILYYCDVNKFCLVLDFRWISLGLIGWKGRGGGVKDIENLIESMVYIYFIVGGACSLLMLMSRDVCIPWCTETCLIHSSVLKLLGLVKHDCSFVLL